MEANPAINRMGEPEEPHGHSEPMPHHAVNYYMIFLALIVLTVVTVLVAFYRFNNELVNVLIALTIASVKATFVARFFMHVKFEGKLIRLILLCPLVLCVILMMALIPDIARGRHVVLNDMIHWFEHGEAAASGSPGVETGATATGGQTAGQNQR
jgi:cytochrome c oxidase subunit IV